MEKAEQIRVLRQLLGHLDAGTNVDAGGIRRNPSDAYTSPERARKEWDGFFREHPQIVGLSADLPESGAFFTRDDFGVPLLATRDPDGRFRAFANVCRHRGVVVESEARGQKRRFSCPFHGWTYDNTGALVGLPMPEHFGKIDRDCHGLVELPAEEHLGFLWVHPQPGQSVEAEQRLSGLAPELESWGFGRLVHTGEDTYAAAMNWKLAIDTFGETYHFKALHRNSLAQSFHGNVQAYDTYGRNHRMALCLKSIDELRGTPEDTWDIRQGAFPVYYLFPNVQLNVGLGGVILVRVYPVPGDPGRSVSRISFYAWPDTLSRDPDMIAQVQSTFGAVIRDEDYVAAAASQIGASSGVQDAVVFGRNEPALHHYHNTYREALGMEPLPLLES
ncbi:MAG: aromatic ring-hydroxylating dioxygenase subunit alpha [Proteobacteria bacterium]|nr:aromatic ring-hydroxylating dioxygenase subunit alpha [Pseudomonadota bacterium]